MESKLRKFLRPFLVSTSLGLVVSGCGAEFLSEDSSSEDQPAEDVIATYSISAYSPEDTSAALTASNLDVRLTDIEFDVFATCANGTTNSVTSSLYTLGTVEQFDLGANCVDPTIELKNIDVTYVNVNNQSVIGTFLTYGETITNNGSVLTFEKFDSSALNPRFWFKELVISRETPLEDIDITPADVFVTLNTKPNSWCSGISVVVTADTLTATFDLPEGASSLPSAAYTFTVDGSSLPANTDETISTVSRQVVYDFSNVLAGTYGTYSFPMSLVPDVGEPDDDQSCEGSITFDLVIANENHKPTIVYAANANVANFDGWGTVGSRYTFDVTNSTSNGEVSFDVTDRNGNATANIVCTGAPSWVNIDQNNDKITFSPAAGDIANDYQFSCHAYDGIINSTQYVWFSVDVL